MGSFNRDRRSSGPRGDFDRPQMHKAVCDSCGKQCEVPFRPTQGKPVYCSDCFRNQPRDDSRGNDRRGDFARPRFNDRNDRDSRPSPQPNYKEQLDYMNAKLDKILRILEGSKPAQTEVSINKVVKAPKVKKVRTPKVVAPVEPVVEVVTEPVVKAPATE